MRSFILVLLILLIAGCSTGTPEKQYCKNQYSWAEQSIDSLENN